MNYKKLNFPFIIFMIIILFVGINCTSKGKKTFVSNDPMVEDIEYSFINMDEYLPTKIVEKANQSFIFPQIENISLPTDFVHDSATYNTLQYIDSSYTQGFLFIQNDTIQYENYWRGQKEDIQHISWSMAKSYISALFGIAMEEGLI
ncbi:MAG: hypothetical protein WDA37_11105, partial [Dysgonamonadaceae bacterium]